MVQTARRHLGEILFKAGLVEKQAIIDAIKAGRASGKRLGQVLLEKGLIDEETLTKAITKQCGLKYTDININDIPADAVKLIPEDLIRRYNVVPIGTENGRLKLAIADPMDVEAMDTIRLRVNREIEFYVASPSRIRSFITDTLEQVSHEESDRLRHSIDATAAELAEFGEDIKAEILRAGQVAGADDGPVVRLVNLIIDTAVNMRASDIHVEPMADRVRIRYRLDGVCFEKDTIPKNMQAPLMTRLKILSGMNIAEKRVPQDGRIKRMIGNLDVDFRVSALPGNHGESIVLRILRPDAVNIGIKALGFEADDYERFHRIIRRPNGIFLVTGPTGSGKTTTLYAALQELNKPDKKIITAEDPIEYSFAGMNQVQVKEDIGLTFERILRAMLRQAPNVILVGEIRDGVVADVAIQAALTGHLVFSTLHTNDAPSAITRLIDMGVKPFLVASSIQAIMAQRLVRVICKNCKVVDKDPDPRYLRLLNITPEDIGKQAIYKGEGCSACQGIGYKGRIAIFEMVELNNEIRELAFSKAPTGEIRKACIAGGMRTLMEDGKIKIFNGITTPAEVAAVAQTEGVVL
jgi:type IV pilus assembly protein PilB